MSLDGFTLGISPASAHTLSPRSKSGLAILSFGANLLALVGTTSAPVDAQPSEPLPPFAVSLPGTPTPAYCTVQSIHPFRPLALSIAVPGAAIHNPSIPVAVISMPKLATTCL